MSDLEAAAPDALECAPAEVRVASEALEVRAAERARIENTDATNSHGATSRILEEQYEGEMGEVVAKIFLIWFPTRLLNYASKFTLGAYQGYVRR